jgi:secondary thiamine-phosphate synthase enzyme
LKAVPEIAEFEMGVMNVFLQHTSAGLTINESWDPDVRVDVSKALDRIVPEDHEHRGLYLHDDEGTDDCPAHIKSSLVSCSLNIPIGRGKLLLGTWQGIWLCEFRDSASSRSVVVTIQGQRSSGSAGESAASSSSASS